MPALHCSPHPMGKFGSGSMSRGNSKVPTRQQPKINPLAGTEIDFGCSHDVVVCLSQLGRNIPVTNGKRELERSPRWPVWHRELGHTLNLCIHSLQPLKAGIITPPTRVCRALSNSRLSIYILLQKCVCVFLYDRVFQAFCSSGAVRISVSSSKALSVFMAVNSTDQGLQ